MRKKIIIFSILFLFISGLFFGTFARGGYLVKADSDEINNVDYGTYHLDTYTSSNIDYEIDVNVFYNAQTKLYYIDVIFKNRIYDFISEDYNENTSAECGDLDFASESGLLSDDGYNDLAAIDFIEAMQENDGDYTKLIFSYELDANGWDYTYITLKIRITDIYIDTESLSNHVGFNSDITFLSAILYNKIYNKGYYIGLDEAYQPAYDEGYGDGHDDGYAEGYTLGETAGYNDGLDIGYYNGYEVGHYDGYTEGEAYGYTNGLDEGYWYGLDEGLQVSGYKDAYDKGVAKAENTATTWFKGLFNGIQGFLNIEIMGVSLGAIILVPFAITFVWFIIRQFRGGGGGD